MQDEADEDEDVSECSQPTCPTYDVLLYVFSRAKERLDLICGSGSGWGGSAHYCCVASLPGLTY